MSVSKRTLVVAGLNVYVYSQSRSSPAPPLLPVAVIFLLHGRLGSTQNVDWVANSLLDSLKEKRNTLGGDKHEPIVVTFDQRNHGSRLVDLTSNYVWNEGPEKHNDRHAVDMYTIQTGTSRDVSFLIDFLPSYLYPSDERTISEWIVAGISLGGHATWITLKNEPRIRVGIPIIGCPDYLSLISQRAKRSSVPLAPPYMPDTFMSLIRRTDPAASTPYESLDSSNPFLGKKVLVLSGAQDPVVPWFASEAFVNKLQVGENGIKKVVVSDVGHECTVDMVAEMTAFIWEQALA